jgi:hypothetical protein
LCSEHAFRISKEEGVLVMKLEELELAPYAQPVSQADLEEGRVYFSLIYADEAMLEPVMETLVFVGRDFEPGDSGQVYFQDILSYRAGVRFDSTGDNRHARFLAGSQEEVGAIFDYEQAVERLVACLKRRKRLAVRQQGHT